ncbi:uncharacterized protein LOC141631168 [Silene latifolia]|uniref:uncharacterized protein LOC141631168 n=1 Tax=Silene latifolia TaxID=37657 RepID=UPI003D770DF9
MKEFEMTDLGKPQYFLGLEVNRSRRYLCVSEEVCKRILKKFRMEDSEIAITPMNANEKLQREDGTGSADEKQIREHCFRTSNKAASRSRKEDFKVHCENNSREGNRGLVLLHGVQRSRTQRALSSSEASMWRRVRWEASNLAEKSSCRFGNEQSKATVIWCDNKSAIAMTKNPAYHARTKHIEVQRSFYRGLVGEGKIELKLRGTNERECDLFTKSLFQAKHQNFMEKIGVCSI